MGGSETWKVEQYKISITPELLKAGNGVLTIKDKAQYKTDYLNLEVHVVIQAKQVNESESDITELTIGIVEDAYLYKDGETIVLDNISDIYITIEWQDMNKGKKIKERIDLFNNEDMLLK
jgi:hypothetical protein